MKKLTTLLLAALMLTGSVACTGKGDGTATTEDGSYVYGYCVAGDTGSFIYDGTGTIVDLFFNTVEECYEFGRRSVIIYVLD